MSEPGHAPRRPPAGVRRLLTVGLALALLTVAYLGAGALADWVGELRGPPSVTAPPDIEPGLAVTVEIPAGSSARDIGAMLARAGVVGSAAQFELAVRSAGAAERLQAGSYDLVTGMSTDTVIDLLLIGPVIETFRVTVREGLRIGEVLEEIAAQTDFAVSELENALADVGSTLLQGSPSNPTAWEGLLFPDTYEFAMDSTPVDVLQVLADTMSQRVGAVDWTALEEGGLSVYEGVVIASLIEAETRVDGDRPLVSSVIANRLELGMPLQIDATVLYALDERGIALTLADLETDSPYNTYLQIGLPPTPIGGPGRKSLEAAAGPADTDYLYYVLTSSSGEHSFTSSYDEFLRWKREAKDAGIIP